MSENSVRVAREIPARLLKSSTVSNARSDTPDSPGSQTGCASPSTSNVGAASPTSTSSSNPIPASPAMGPSSNNYNNSGPPVQRSYSHRGGRYGDNGYMGNFSRYSHHGKTAYNQRPPCSKALLDFMMRQWQAFETHYAQRAGQQMSVDDDYAVTPSSPRQPHSNQSNQSPHRNSHRNGGVGNWPVNRRYSDNGHHHHHNGQQTQHSDDYPPPTSASQQLPPHEEQYRNNNTGSLRRNLQGPFQQNQDQWQRARLTDDQPWQRGQTLLGRKNSPNNTTNRSTGGHPRLPITASAIPSMETQQLMDSSSGPAGDIQLANSSTGKSPATTVCEPIIDGIQTLSVNSRPHSSSAEKNKLSIENEMDAKEIENEANLQYINDSTPSQVTVEESDTSIITTTTTTDQLENTVQLVTASSSSSPAKSIPIMKTTEQSRRPGTSTSLPTSSRRLVGSCRSVSGMSAGGGVESISVSVCSSSFGSLVDQVDASSTGGEQYFTPDPPASPSNSVAATSLAHHHHHTSSSFSPPSPPIVISPSLVSAVNR